MKNLSNFIFEKILINKDTKVTSKYLADATYNFHSRSKLKGWLCSVFDSNIEIFISSYLDINKDEIYVFYAEYNSPEYNQLDKIITDLRKIHNIPENKSNNIKPKTLTDNKHTCSVNIFDEYDYREFFIFSYRNNNSNKKDVVFIIQE